MNKLFVLLLLFLTLPTFALMLRPGIWTVHDPHLFRQFEFNLCAREFAVPCRWAPDATLGFGQPLFNFYPQFSYWIGQIFITLGVQIIDSVKITFILSILLSTITMYLLASKFWGRVGALVSALFYLYAPYRAVDVWVRGALPESLAFIFYPLVLLWVEQKKYLLFSLTIFLLLITHNLSLFMFIPFLFFWWLVRSRDLKFIFYGILALLFGAFYLLPVIIESDLVTVTDTISKYYTFSHHFTSLRQLFISRFWGYGGSTWGPNDTMSFSVGHLHWLLPILIYLMIFIRYKSLPKLFILRSSFFILLALLALFLTHGKSEFIWKAIPGMSYIQFPWRFLSLSTLFLSLAAGASAILISKKFVYTLLLLLLLLNVDFFRPDIWRSINDQEQFSGPLWEEQRASSLTDFWPKASTVPQSPAPPKPQFLLGEGTVSQIKRFAHTHQYVFNIESDYAKVAFPIVNFPTWQAKIDTQRLKLFTWGEIKQVSARIPKGRHTVTLKFNDPPIRALGNALSLSILIFIFSIYAARHARKFS